MGTTIEATAVVQGGGWRTRGARRLSDAAARDCLRAADVQPNDVDVLLNAGIYRDRNLGEPALAALIQEDIGANLGDPPVGGHGTFSFDVANGSAGVLTALQIADGLLAARIATRVLVVAGDANPGHRMARDFPFAPVAGAMLCRWSESPAGFVRFASASFPNLADKWTSRVEFARGRNSLVVDIAPEYDTLAAGCAVDVAAKLLAGEGLVPGSLDAVVVSPARDTFRTTFAAGLGVPDARVTAGDVPAAHTATPIVAFDTIRRRDDARTVLFVAAAAGMTIATALYRL